MKENKQDSSIFFYRQASKLARIGNWELDVINNKLYWSDIVHELHETNPKTFTPDLETGLSFYREDFRSMVKEIILSSIESGSAFDFEAVIITKKRKKDGFVLSEIQKCIRENAYGYLVELRIIMIKRCWS